MSGNRGRKRKNGVYFGEEEEEAVKKFLLEDDVVIRNAIYDSHLRFPIEKMVESIIRRYKLYRRDISYEDLHCDTISFLMTKFNKFNPDKNKKSYSYFGTICKNYLLGQLIRSDKVTKQILSYEDMHLSLENDPDLTYEIDEVESPLDEFIIEMKTEVINILNTTRVNNNEKKVGQALIAILNDWVNIFPDVEGGNKYTKSLILSHIREITQLTTKEIRLSMKKFKIAYFGLKGKWIDDGLI